MLGFSQTSIVLPADIPACVPWRLILLPLRHVHQVHQVHQVHLAKCFVTRLVPVSTGQKILIFRLRILFCKKTEKTLILHKKICKFPVVVL